MDNDRKEQWKARLVVQGFEKKRRKNRNSHMLKRIKNVSQHNQKGGLESKMNRCKDRVLARTI